MLRRGINMANIIGIDLGTTFSAVARLDENGKPAIVANDEGGNITPSVVEFTSKDSYQVGKEAKKMLGVSKNIVPGGPNDEAKRHMGDSEKVYEIFGEKHTPVTISALILKKLKEDVEAVHGPIDSAIVTVPANFANEAREGTKEAAQLAGLNVELIINEPTAAALAYSFLSSDELNGTFVIYDLGGGTFDCSIARVRNQDIEILTSEGVRVLGGKDFDNALLEIVKEKFHNETGNDLNLRSFNINKAEEVKITLSKREKTMISITSAEGVADIEVTREEFEEAISTLVAQAEAAVEAALSRLKLKPNQITDVILVGGSTRIPCIQKSVSKIFGKDPKLYGNPDEMVALGAAIYSAYKSEPSQLSVLQRKAISNISLQEVTNHCFGIVAEVEKASGEKGPENTIVIPRDEKIPCSVTASYFTAVDDQTDVRLQVTQSATEERDVNFVRVIWDGNLKLPTGHPAGQEIKVTYSFKEGNFMKAAFVLSHDRRHRKEVDLDIDRKTSDKSTTDVSKFKVE